MANEFELKYDCKASLLIGDYNLIFKADEAKNRAISLSERHVATGVKQMMEDSQLTDIWKNKALFTWRRPNTETFSSIDRILFRQSELVLTRVQTNWSLSCSDHAAIEANFAKPDKIFKARSKIPRLDPSLIKETLTIYYKGLTFFLR